MFTVPVATPAATDLACKNHGFCEDALHVTWSPTIVPFPSGVATVQLLPVPSPNDTLVNLARVCVANSAYPDATAILHLRVAPSASILRAESVERPVNCEVVLPTGVINGATAAVPVESVSLGVANAGDATTTDTTTNTNAASTPRLKALIVRQHPFSRQPCGRQD